MTTNGMKKEIEEILLRAKDKLFHIVQEKKRIAANQTPTELFVNIDNLIGSIYPDFGQAILDLISEQKQREREAAERMFDIVCNESDFGDGYAARFETCMQLWDKQNEEKK